MRDDVVLMEVLAGARDDRHALELERLLARSLPLPVRAFIVVEPV
jgi:hypothetical protein